MKSSHIGGVAVLVVIVGGAAFWGGISYAKSQTPSRGAFNQQFGGFGGRSGISSSTRMFMQGGALGSVVSVSGNSLTLQTPDGSSKVVFFSASTPINKTVSGSASDLVSGTNVLVAGTPNSDGSVTASSIEIRPAGMGFGRGPGSAQQQTSGASSSQ